MSQAVCLLCVVPFEAKTTIKKVGGHGSCFLILLETSLSANIQETQW